MGMALGLVCQPLIFPLLEGNTSSQASVNELAAGLHGRGQRCLGDFRVHGTRGMQSEAHHAPSVLSQALRVKPFQLCVLLFSRCRGEERRVCAAEGCARASSRTPGGNPAPCPASCTLSCPLSCIPTERGCTAAPELTLYFQFSSQKHKLGCTAPDSSSWREQTRTVPVQDNKGASEWSADIQMSLIKEN